MQVQPKLIGCGVTLKTYRALWRILRLFGLSTTAIPNGQQRVRSTLVFAGMRKLLKMRPIGALPGDRSAALKSKRAAGSSSVTMHKAAARQCVFKLNIRILSVQL